MRLWRISAFSDLSGQGGVLESGRWHTRPKRVLYCADHPSTAFLEVFVHLSINFADVPNHYKLMTIEVPDDLSVTSIDDEGLPDDWRNRIDATRNRGDELMNVGEVPIFSVPSSIITQARIYVINVDHPDVDRLGIVSSEPVRFDPRLWKVN